MARYVLLPLLLFLPLWVFAATPATQDQGAGQDTYWGSPKQGFYFYKDPAPEEEDVEEKEDPPMSSVGAPEKMPTAADFTYDELWKMYPPKFQEIYNNTLHKAMMTKSLEDTRDYILMNDISQRRARAFAEMGTYVASTTPQFNTLKDFPMATPGRRGYLKSRFDSVRQEMSSLQDRFALLFFYSPTCNFCVEQDQILKRFNYERNWEIKPINVEERPDLAMEFNIQTTPTVFLINRDNPEPFPVAYGVTTVPDLERNIYQGVRVLEKGPEGHTLYDFQQGSSLDPFAVQKKTEIKTFGGVPGWQSE
ncbi:MAG: conjugal transfer protein TraF [Desulfuromonadales bacterium]|nr:conjugal transfer protein TraF [Desulfuromonadales bacterium]MBN2793246.1 conjugal transfer protein TraF [Desulfuromonadales bacterium]